MDSVTRRNTHTRPQSSARRWFALAAWVGLCLAIGIGTGLLFKPGAWFATLDKPFFNPPAALFAPVWTLLYISMGIAAWRIWCLSVSTDRTRALRWFGVQLALNAAWTPVFFGAHSLAGAMAVIVLMLIAIAITIYRFRQLEQLAAWLMAPYLAWVSFATVLNGALLALNNNY
jgi:translocator protein